MPDQRLQIEISQLAGSVAHCAFWSSYLSKVASAAQPIGLHLAIFVQPFLSLVLDRQKTVESRFSRTRCAPYDQIWQGDIIMLKEPGGPVRGLALAKRVRFFDLHHEPIDRIRAAYWETIRADDDFWEQRRDSTYATLIELAEPISIEAFPCSKRDRRGWVALTSPQLKLALL